MKLIRDLASAKAFLTRRMSIEAEGTDPQLARGILRVFGQELSVEEAVARILREVRQNGDSAVIDYTRRIDGIELDGLEVTADERSQAQSRVPSEVLESLKLAAHRIRRYQSAVMRHGPRDFLQRGLGQKVIPIERAGLYVPGGTALYPSTVLMTAIPARVAGVEEVVLATPPGKDGRVAPLVLAAAGIAQVDMVFKMGGAQAIGALAYGTDTVPRVDKIFGPGNVFVQTAKRLVYGAVGIDTIQGPTEAVVIADDSVEPAWSAADLLAQAEHDPQSSSILITTSQEHADKVQQEIGRQLKEAARQEVIRQSLEARGAIIVVGSVEQGIELSNLYAPEHLCLMVRNAQDYAPMVKHAGALFLGAYSTHVLGDYMAGPSHALPTAGAARFSSALSVTDFLKVTSVVSLSAEEAKALAREGASIARAEGFQAHAAALEIRRARDVGKRE